MRSPPASQPAAQTDAEPNALHGKHILLLVGGGIAAYKVPDLVRHLQKDGAQLRCVLTRAGREFVTPMTLAALVGEPVHEHLFDPAQETQFGHIRLARAADLVLVAPATANLIAKAAHGLADDLASTILLASRAPLLVAPAMNVAMWEHAATQDNLRQLGARGAHILAPASGDLACGEEGAGRLREPQEIAAAAAAMLAARTSLHGRRAVVTAGPTWEALDPVRYLSARSSGKQAPGAQRLPGGPGGAPRAPAVQAGARRQHGGGCRGNLLWLAQPPRALFAARQVAARWRQNMCAARPQLAQIVLRRGMLPHRHIHGGRYQKRRSAGKQNRAGEVIGQPVRGFGYQIGGGGRNQHQIGGARQPNMPELGFLRGVKQMLMHRLAHQRRQRHRGHKFPSRSGQHTAQLRAIFLQMAHQVRHFVGSDAAAHQQQDMLAVQGIGLGGGLGGGLGCRGRAHDGLITHKTCCFASPIATSPTIHPATTH
ncbi:MAG: bifunctional phosphopantothenoylcysteine decarboxylase/phosphopantothenate--cysteine ligase CoaBC [Hyphomicrobiales bacterium]|nr:bifunctional phosphopantothenoylcysteine decarboxylase/phosphopantothenate--cysteine ligase CoaBC [Hyphomicrobiales bacterium]